MGDSRDAQSQAADRILAIARALNIQPPQPTDSDQEIPPEFIARLRQVLLADPSIPKPNPTVSLWQEPAHPTLAAIQSPTLPSLTDFIVIGSGVTGCSVTKSLLENPSTGPSPGAPPHVTVLEARTLVSGATGRNGGHFVSPAGHYYETMSKRHGEEAAKDISRFSILNVQRIMSLVRELDPKLAEECELRDVVKITAAIDQDTWKGFMSSLSAFRKAIPEHQTYHRTTNAEEMEQKWDLKGCYGSIEHMSGAVWPYRLVTGIFERLLAQYPYNLSIETNTPATAIEYAVPDASSFPGSEYKYKVTTPRGVIYTKQIVHCTNGHAAHLLPPMTGRLHPFRGTMSVQKAPASLDNTGGDRSWSAVFPTTLDAKTGLYTEGLFYLQQNVKTGDIWLGTERSNIFETIQGDDTYVSKEGYEPLRDFLPKYFSQWPKGAKSDLKAIWTGIQGHTSDGLPMIGRLPDYLTGRPGSDGEWFAGGYSGYGMDKAWMSGEAAAKMIAGEGVPEWLPKCFLITEDRMHNRLTVEKTIAKWVSLARTGHW